MGKDTSETIMTPKQQMNIWVCDQISTLERVADQSCGTHTAKEQAYVRGVMAGLRIFQDAWLHDEFEPKRTS